MKNKFILAGLLSWGCLSTYSQAAVSANLNDLILGFRASGGQGQSVNLEVNIGSISVYTAISSTASIPVTQLNVADIVATYGLNWASRTDLTWGIVGSSGRISAGPGGSTTQPAPTVWATYPETTIGTQSTPWVLSSLSRGAVSQASQAIESLYNSSPGSLNGATSTTNSTTSSTINSNLSGSWSYQDSYQAGQSFAYFNPTVNVATTIASGSYSAADLFQVASGTTAPTYVGTFGLNSNGVLTYSGAASYFKTAKGTNTFTANPISQTAVAGSTVVLTSAATGTPAPSYQWYFNGNIMAGQTSANLVLTSIAATNTGSYTVVATNSTGSNTSTEAKLSLATSGTVSRLFDLSVLANVATGNTLTLGLVNGGTGTSGATNLLVRASGQYLTSVGLSGMPDTSESLLQGSTVLATNNDWNSPSTNGVIVSAADVATGAFANVAANALDSALVYSVAPVSGGYTVQIQGNPATGGKGGQVIGEIYDATSSPTATTPRLVNISCLNNIAAKDSITAGFVITGASKTVLIRATGTGLNAIKGLENFVTLADPKIVLYNLNVSPNVVLTTSIGSANSTLIANYSKLVSDSVPATAADSAILITLPPGNYSAVVNSAAGTNAGNVILEVYEVQ